MANEFNQFFASVGENTIKKISNLVKESNYNLSERSFVPRMYSLLDQFILGPVDCTQVKSIVDSMAVNVQSPGIDKIPTRVIKNRLPAILTSLIAIINASFDTANFPNAWKTAEVTPILKEGDYELPNNNRPISLLHILSKVCERVAHNQLTSYLSSRNLLSTKQCGNKQWHSTETSIIHTTDTILSAIDKKKLTAVVLLEMSKTFDSINHQILFTKLRDVCASESVILWFRSTYPLAIKLFASIPPFQMSTECHKGVSLARFYIRFTWMSSLPYQNTVHFSYKLMTLHFLCLSIFRIKEM